MVGVLTFAAVLLLAVLLSQVAECTVLSTATIFLVAGFLAGPELLGLVPARQPLVRLLAELALVAVLFNDGMKVRRRSLARLWGLPARALLLGLPLTLAATALFARFVAGLSWAEAYLVGAVLSPTDPVFASALVGRKDISLRLRHLLNVESGLNDGLALPLVFAGLALLGRGDGGPGHTLADLALGVGLPLAVCLVERLPVLAVARSYQPLFAFAVGLLVFAAARVTGANEYLASFAGGITLGNVRPQGGREADHFGEALTELLKLAAVLAFGASIAPSSLAALGWGDYAFAFLALVAARPLGLGPALLNTPLSWSERLTALWFGPRGFGSVVYGIMVLQAGVPAADRLFHLIAVVIAASMLAHSSTDILAARWLRRPRTPGRQDGVSPAGR